MEFAEKEFIKNPRRTGTICALTDPLSRGCRARAGNLCSPPLSRLASPSLPAASWVCFQHTFLKRIIWHGRRSLGFCTKVHLTKAPGKSGSLWSGAASKGQHWGQLQLYLKCSGSCCLKTSWVCSLLSCSEVPLEDKSDMKTQCFSNSKICCKRKSFSGFLSRRQFKVPIMEHGMSATANGPNIHTCIY